MYIHTYTAQHPLIRSINRLKRSYWERHVFKQQDLQMFYLKLNK